MANGWDFPDHTVAVKSFALEAEPGKPETRRWIETRFLTKQVGQWYGYSYVWNEEQTDATLVPKEGMDREFAVGTARQKWHYPSRTECMVCHSRAANYVLGLSTVQMNKVHDYNGVKGNQLHVLEQLGVLDIRSADHMKREMRKELEDAGKKEKEIDRIMDERTGTRLQREPKTASLLAKPPEKCAPGRSLRPQPAARCAARSYLHANCAICHVGAGGGNAQFEVDFFSKADKLQLFDVKPQHNTFGLKEARLIAPGAPDRSVLLHRVSTRDQGHMPPLATSIVDREAVTMLREWVLEMKK